MSIMVLIADDHAVVRDGLRMILESQPGIQVVGDVADGRAAVREATRLRPDVVIMDIAMSELNGIEATQQIHVTCPSTQVVILSLHATSEHIRRALKAGARGYLLKEAAGSEVVDAVHAVQAGQRYLCQKVMEQVTNDYLVQEGTEETKSPLDRLSSREREVLQLVVEGKTSAEIAETLVLSSSTVETYRSRMMEKLDIRNLPELVKFAIRHGLTSADD